MWLTAWSMSVLVFSMESFCVGLMNTDDITMPFASATH
jgi:hypothetical protein